ncbi:MAG: hypothetical protein N3F66_14130 [Spirochaetes bacterium]|nr:hypothetical protein [Spirochaetota bacterium]
MFYRLVILMLCCAIAPGIAFAQISPFNQAISLYAGYIPSLGGNLYSYEQEHTFGSATGIDGINKSQTGFSTAPIHRLMGATVGATFKVVMYDFFTARIGINYFKSVWGGKGKTVYNDGGTNRLLECNYNFDGFDIPLTLGIVIPFYKDMKITFSCGVAYAWGRYKNKFESDAPLSYKGHFKGTAYPLVINTEGEYFINEKFALTTSLTYYKGTTEIIKDSKKGDGNTDYAPIDFSGYRFLLGVSYYFKPI